MENQVRILCFFWNADGTRICKNLAEDNPRGGIFDYFGSSCQTAQFFPGLTKLIQQNNAEIVVIATAEEASYGSYLHSGLLSERMPEIGYKKIDSVAQDGVGKGTLRLSVYSSKPELVSNIKLSMYGYICQSQALGRYSGAACIQMLHSKVGDFSFIVVDLPDAYDSLKGVKEDPNNVSSYRAKIRASNKACLLNIVDKYSPRSIYHTIMLGDFNYEIEVENTTIKKFVSELGADISEARLKSLLAHDELRKEFWDPPLSEFQEGVNNEGPLFMPTSKMNKNRPSACRISKGQKSLPIDANLCFSDDGNSYPSWRDRILYRNSNQDRFVLKCVGYNRLDLDGMQNSVHAGVIGIFDIVDTRR